MKRVIDPYKATVCGIGYIGGDKYAISIKHKHTKIYQLWHNLFNRCYNSKYHLIHPAYLGCTVAKEWHNFQNFAEWYMFHHTSEMINWQLDKDILVAGNKIYGPNTCCLVPREINLTIRNNLKIRSKYSKGVSLHNNRFKVNVDVGKHKYCGSFEILEDAIACYTQTKQNYIRSLAEDYKNILASHVFQALYVYDVTI